MLLCCLSCARMPYMAPGWATLVRSRRSSKDLEPHGVRRLHGALNAKLKANASALKDRLGPSSHLVRVESSEGECLDGGLEASGVWRCEVHDVLLGCGGGGQSGTHTPQCGQHKQHIPENTELNARISSLLPQLPGRLSPFSELSFEDPESARLRRLVFGHRESRLEAQ